MTTKPTAVEQDLLAEIDALELSEQSKRLRQRYFDEPVRAAVERPRIAMEAWKETKGQPIESRRAYLFKRVLNEVPVVIHDYERTAGSETKWFRGMYPTVDHNPALFLEQLPRRAKGVVTLSSSAHHGQVAQEDWGALENCARFFQGQTAPDQLRELRKQVMGTWWEDFTEAKGTVPFDEPHSFAGVPLFGKVLTHGLRGIIREAEERLAGFARLEEDDPEKLLFWRASITSCEATIALAKRYADLAGSLAEEEKEPTRRQQLQQIADACREVPAGPARSFFEALQSVRLVHLACRLEGTYPASLERLDQILYPYFTADLVHGRLTLSEAVELLADLFSYLGRQDMTLGILLGEEVQASSAIVNITLGGVTRNGRDACNSLTYLVLHVAGLTKYAQPQFSFRLSRLTPRQFLLKTAQTNYRVGGGIPQILNDEHVIKYLVNRGVPLEEARDWVVHGCVQPVSPGQRTDLRHAVTLNIPLAVDLALHNGVAPRTGKHIGLATGDPQTFTAFEDLYAAVKKQVEHLWRRCAWQCRFAARIWGQHYRLPFLSSVLPGCVERGTDVLLGGQRDNSLHYALDRGFVSAADALIAVKKLVFDEKRLSMTELLEALDSNFESERGEEIRRLCLAAPKYGNDNPKADEMVRDLAKFSALLIFSEASPFGPPYAIQRIGVGWHYYGGKGVGALADGRKKEEPLADGSLSPMRGRDTAGPTAVLKSALAADFKESAVSVLNLRFPITLMQSPEALEKLAALTKTFVDNGGTHIQFNLLDHRVLLEARKHPERYRDLVVRVAGYSAYFIHLTPEIQDDIIRRTEQAL